MNSDSVNGDPHLLDEALDYHAGRLDPARSRQVEEHLRACAECAEHFAFVRDIERDIVRANARHLRPEDLVRYADDPAAGPTDEEQAHLEACGSCREELEWARAAPSLARMEEPGAEALRPAGEPRSGAPPAGAVGPEEHGVPFADRIRGILRLPAWAWGSLALGLAAMLVVIVLHGSEEGVPSPYAAIARVEPLPAAQIERGGATPPGVRALFRQAMADYARGAYRAAEGRLREAAALAPENADVKLYLGSSRLLLGRVEGAIAALQDAVRLARSERLQEESKWQLANACLAAGRPDEAAALLRQVIAARADRRVAAEEMLEKIASTR